jgi:hypothetical protein
MAVNTVVQPRVKNLGNDTKLVSVSYFCFAKAIGRIFSGGTMP